MIHIRRIQPQEIPAAKELIYRVAHEVFDDTRPLEESIAFYEARGQLHDMDDVQHTYFDNQGTFLVMTEGERLIGTGAILKLDHQTCELKRLWLLFEYHGKGLGYRMIQELLSFARLQGYRRIRLETDREDQSRAYQLYKRLGFYEIPRYSDNAQDAAMELIL
jgi:putative acetyltransferase